MVAVLPAGGKPWRTSDNPLLSQALRTVTVLAMLIRRLMLLVFLLTQVAVSVAMPLAMPVAAGAAHAGGMTHMQADEATADPVTSHCGGEAGIADNNSGGGHANGHGSGHDNCTDDCRLCAACAMVAPAPLVVAGELPDATALLPLAGAAPPGISHLPYRPPARS